MSKHTLTIEETIMQLKAGKQVILVDDEDRENEGDLFMAAEKVTADDINFMARFGRGLICLTLTHERLEKLNLSRMAERNQSRFGTNFYTSIEAREGVTTGISAADRAQTVKVAVGPEANPRCVVSPGHVFPIGAQPGGVLVRAGQTEGSVDLARLAGLEPAGVICEIMKDDGTMARRPDLEVFAEEHDLGIVTIEQLIQYRLGRETQIEPVNEASVVPAGLSKHFRLVAYRSRVNRAPQYMALVLGDSFDADKPVLVRMHRASLPTDVFGLSNGCGCAKNTLALRKIEEAGAGVLVYVLPESVDLEAQIEQVKNDDVGTERPELREFGLGAQILASLGLSKIQLMTDNPKRIVGLQGFGLSVVEQVPLTGSENRPCRT